VKCFRLALVPGDGIGKEVLAEAVRVLKGVEERVSGFQLQMTELPWGSDYYFAHGSMAPADYLHQLRAFDAVFLGALGDPTRLPDAVSLAPLVQIRQQFDQYVCMRPSVLWPGVCSPLRSPGTIDMVVVRENSEGEYIVCGGRAKQGEPDEIAVQSAVHTRKGVERILRFSFELAQTRRGRLTMITKSNALVYGMVLWDDVLEAVRRDYPRVEADLLHADAAAMDFVRRPSRFDVVVASNLFGDILTDLGGVVAGGLGLAPSANINPERKFPSMFEPVHGSAPDIAGKGVANPVAAILSGAMMLQWLGLDDAASLIRTAVKMTLASGDSTPDVGGDLTTKQVADRIIDRILCGAAEAKTSATEPAPV
jgi:tartrate dehydrogenase/decarboxylase/D-malate dehydrogenase